MGFSKKNGSLRLQVDELVEEEIRVEVEPDELILGQVDYR
jgi:hypothetical protein